ncbi:DUF1302 domain-containing protein [Pseudomonas sp. BN102]|uniref:DUF1302 domain-containing protein n=1 Tax=Pseudomonas sp. BN102 TaxID=2567886 RepID=UPI0024574DC4|nr:DUF1302 domain-containing protein [Pseudomonas sp. BN102]MDH4610464.1 DUF1302 domain-containing protein [Pseudomonas sp. BN102]
MKDQFRTTAPLHLRPSLLAAGIAIASLGSPHLLAANFQLNDDWGLDVNTTLSLGTSWSLEDADEKLITKADAASIGKEGRGINYNGDDGKLNFDKGDTFSTVFKGLTDFDLNDGGQGAFLRLKYWYDHELETTNGDFTRFDDSGWQDLAKFKGFEALDAYVWKDFDIQGHKLSTKLGKHVLSWGEALFLQNGVNAINPLDISAFNRPGVELKEGQLPVEMFSFNLDLSDAMNVEGFWQYNFRPSVIDGCGTFFSPSDNTQEGCQFTTLVTGRGTTAQNLAAGGFVPRAGTEWASDTGQYGLAMHYVFEELNSTDLGLYFANYHNRTPVVNGLVSTGTTAATLLNQARYFTVYPEDVRMFGASLSSVLGTTAVFGELSYRPNQPIAFNGNDTIATLTRATTSPTTPSGGVLPGTEFQGYARLPVWQFSLGATDTINNVLGATRLAWAAEAGANWVDDIDGQRFGRSGAFGRTPPTDGSACVAVPPAGAIGSGGLSRDEILAYNADNCNTKGLVDHFSWGYRARLSLSYEGLLPATVITPSVNWRHDVDGYGPNFQEGQQAASLALAFDYRNNYSLELAYNAFFGSNEFSTIDDRDYASVTLKASF